MPHYENQLFCHPALLREVDESVFTQCKRISILDSHQVEQNIFITRNEDTSEYEVRICKYQPVDTYMLIGATVPFKRYVANDDFASFFFDSFYFSCRFLEILAEAHPEAKIRPCIEK